MTTKKINFKVHFFSPQNLRKEQIFFKFSTAQKNQFALTDSASKPSAERLVFLGDSPQGNISFKYSGKATHA